SPKLVSGLTPQGGVGLRLMFPYCSRGHDPASPPDQDHVHRPACASGIPTSSQGSSGLRTNQVPPHLRRSAEEKCLHWPPGSYLSPNAGGIIVGRAQQNCP